MGRYVPPDVEGTTSGNKLHKKHPLGNRAKPGSLTVRFEMPFPIWCSTCPQPTIIGQGVRFNAAKAKVGNYYSTSIWAFTFRHAACGGTIEMRTDPQNTAYVVVRGATKRDTGEDKVKEGDSVIMTEGERAALRSNAFASLEKTIADRKQFAEAATRIDDLTDYSGRHWDDPYAQNQRLRRAFRADRKERQRRQAADDRIKDRLGLGVELVPASREDQVRASLVDFGGAHDADAALQKPLFAAKKAKKGFAETVVANTRAAKDPFLVKEKNTATRIAGVKGGKKMTGGAEAAPGTGSPGLVAYDDSD